MGGTGVKKDLFANSGTAQGLSNQYSSNALGIQSTLAPQLAAEATNPQGYNPTEMGQMQTAAQQTAGGSNASAAGQAGLLAARTRNAGAGQAATSEAARGASQNLSETNAGIQSSNAALKAKQQQSGLSGEESMYGTDVNAGNNALGLSNQALGMAGQQKPGFWGQFGQNFANDWLNSAVQGVSAIGGS